MAADLVNRPSFCAPLFSESRLMSGKFPRTRLRAHSIRIGAPLVLPVMSLLGIVKRTTKHPANASYYTVQRQQISLQGDFCKFDLIKAA